MECLKQGKYPSARHNGASWRNGDAWKKKRQGQPLGVHAATVQVRGDWMFYKQLFNFPSWSPHRICWKCRANKHTFKQCGLSAPWRSQRRLGQQFLQELIAAGLRVSEFFKCPGLLMDHLMIDWLHAVDLGVAEGVIGNLFWDVIPFLDGQNTEDRVAYFFRRIKHFYHTNKCDSRFTNLTKTMIKQDGKPPKLRAKGAETRTLLPFALELAAEFASKSKHMEQVHFLFHHLLEVSNCLANAIDTESAGTHCRKFSMLY